MKKLIIALIVPVLFSCEKNMKDALLLPEKAKKEKPLPVLTLLPVTTTGDVFACDYVSKFTIGKTPKKRIVHSYIWCLQNQDPVVITPEPGVNGNMLLFGSNTDPFHSNPASKKVGDIKNWITAAITEIGGSDPVSGQWQCEIDSANPNQINVTIYDNISGCGNVETQFPNIGSPAIGSLHTAIFVSFEMR